MLLGECLWMQKASTVEDNHRSNTLISSYSLAYRWFKGKQMNDFLVLATFWKSCVNEAIFDEILVSLSLK